MSGKQKIGAADVTKPASTTWQGLDGLHQGQAICEVIMSIRLMGFKHLRRMGGGADVRR